MSAPTAKIALWTSRELAIAILRARELEMQFVLPPEDSHAQSFAPGLEYGHNFTSSPQILKVLKNVVR